MIRRMMKLTRILATIVLVVTLFQALEAEAFAVGVEARSRSVASSSDCGLSTRWRSDSLHQASLLPLTATGTPRTLTALASTPSEDPDFQEIPKWEEPEEKVVTGQQANKLDDSSTTSTATVTTTTSTSTKNNVPCPDCDQCDGSGRIAGGLGAVLPWVPIKAYRPCPRFVERGGSYQRSGQGLDEIAFGRDSTFTTSSGKQSD